MAVSGLGMCITKVGVLQNSTQCLGSQTCFVALRWKTSRISVESRTKISKGKYKDKLTEEDVLKCESAVNTHSIYPLKTWLKTYFCERISWTCQMVYNTEPSEKLGSWSPRKLSVAGSFKWCLSGDWMNHLSSREWGKLVNSNSCQSWSGEEWKIFSKEKKPFFTLPLMKTHFPVISIYIRNNRT